jgi:acetyl esterase/lipase
MPSPQSKRIKVVAQKLSKRMLAERDLESMRKIASMGSGGLLLPRGTRTGAIHAGEAGPACEWILPAVVDDGMAAAGASGAAAAARTDAPLILYFHGGGWVLGWYHTHRMLTARLAQAAGMPVLAVDYRLAPEHPFPSALDDCLAAYRWLLAQGWPPSRILFAGDSAGGNLVVAVMLALRDSGEPLPAAGACISPMTDHLMTGESFHARTDALLTEEFVAFASAHYLAGTDPRAPLASPLYADLSGLPPLLIHAGGDEILLSDCTRLAENARKAGVEVELEIWPGMWHVWHSFAPFLPEAKEAIEHVAGFAKRSLGAAKA